MPQCSQMGEIDAVGVSAPLLNPFATYVCYGGVPQG